MCSDFINKNLLKKYATYSKLKSFLDFKKNDLKWVCVNQNLKKQKSFKIHSIKMKWDGLMKIVGISNEYLYSKVVFRVWCC